MCPQTEVQGEAQPLQQPFPWPQLVGFLTFIIIINEVTLSWTPGEKPCPKLRRTQGPCGKGHTTNPQQRGAASWSASRSHDHIAVLPPCPHPVPIPGSQGQGTAPRCHQPSGRHGVCHTPAKTRGEYKLDRFSDCGAFCSSLHLWTISPPLKCFTLFIMFHLTPATSSK